MTATHVDDFRGTARFQIRRRLGAGGMGVVYEAFDRERSQRVALKTLLRLDAGSLYRFKHEFRTIAGLSHPNLVRLHELFSEGDQWFFTMELVEGEDFLSFVRPAHELPEDDPNWDVTDSLDCSESTQSVIAPPSPPTEADSEARPAAAPATEPMPSGDPTSPSGMAEPSGGTEPDASSSHGLGRPEVNGVDRPKSSRPHLVRLRAALRQVAEVLDELHGQGRLHRDIKPSNVLVSRRGRVVLLDFGLSIDAASQAEPQTTEGRVVGTVSYMSPEQAAGQTLDPASDWYSVGVMLYRALTGRLPFTGRHLDVLMAKQSTEPPPPSSLVEGIPAELEQLCVDLLRTDPEARPTGDEVLRRLGSRGGAEHRLGSHARPFVGRSRQLERLEEALARLGEGRPVAAFVHGPSGVGKTACVERFLEARAERGDAVVLAGRCYEQESVAYKALDTLIDSLSRYLRRISRVEREALMPREVAALARVFPVLRRVDSVAEAPQRGVDIPDQHEIRRRAFGALREMLTRIGDRHPLILAIDDLQWGDLDSANLLIDLLRPPDPPALMLLASYRREDAGNSRCLRTILDAAGEVPTLAERLDVPVEPLDPEESLQLVFALIGRDDPPARVVAEMIVREAGGSPYFLDELVQFLKEGGELGDSISTSSEISLDNVLWGRIRRLPTQAREVLEVLAVAGRPVRQAIVCRAAGQSAGGFDSLESLRVQHLIRGTGPGVLDDVETYHDRIRETIIARLDPATRARWHAGLARELVADGGADPEMLAVHFEGASDPARAGGYYAEAADEGAQALAFDRAANLYRKSIWLLPDDEARRLRLQARLADALAHAGRSLDAAITYRLAADQAEPADLLDLQRRAAYQFFSGGYIEEGLETIRSVLGRVGLRLPRSPAEALVRLIVERLRLAARGLRSTPRDESDIPPEELMRVDVSMAVALGISNVDVIRGAMFQSQSLRLCLKAGEPMRLARSLSWEAVHSACDGLPGRRRTARLIERATALANRLDDPHVWGMVYLSRSAREFLEGRFAGAIEEADRARETLRERCTGVAWERTTNELYGLWSHFYAGRLADLKVRLADVVKEARTRGDLYLEATLLPYLGAVGLLADDRPDEASDQADEVIGRWTQDGFHVQHLDHLYARLYVDLYRGDGRAAWSRVEETGPMLRGSLLLRIQQVRLDVLHLSGRAAVAAAAAGDADRLRDAEGFAARIERERPSWADGLASLIRAGVASVRGDRDAAAGALRDAAGRLDAVPMIHFAAAARRQLGQLLGGDEGHALVAGGDATLRAQGVLRPDRMVDCLAPGFKQA